MTNKRLLVSSLALVLSAGVLAAGCTSNNSSKEAQPSTSPAGGNASPQAQAATTYPIKTDVTLTSWQVINGNLRTVGIQNFADTFFGKELVKRTGVNVKYTHPEAGHEQEKFNLMIASNQLPDIVEWNWAAYPGGPTKAINDKVITPLNDIIKKDAPNLQKIINDHPEWARMFKTDSGQFYVFPMLREADWQLVFQGPMLRKDWLDELGLQVPTTIDEWHTVLKAFKDKKGATAPFTARYTTSWGIADTFLGAYQTSGGFFVDDQGKVHYGPAEANYKAALTTLHAWYEEGLIDKDFAIPDGDGKILDNKITSGASGATVYLVGGGMGRWLDTMKPKDPKYDLVAAPYPVLKKGDKPFIGQRDYNYSSGASAAISASSKNIDLAAKWLDYAYSPEGKMLFNYGIEGESYTKVNNVPKFTDLINKNPKFNQQQILSQYTKQNGPYMQDKDRNTNKYPEQDQAAQTWANTDAAKHELPPFITPTPEESQQIAKILTDLTSYKEEMFVKFVMGKESLDNFEKYQSQLKTIGVDKVLAIYQAAYDRYLKR